MNNFRKFFAITLVVLVSSTSHAQDDLLSLLEQEEGDKTHLTEATFKATRIINGHSIEVRSAKVLQFIISHRFGRVNTGGNELWGLDESTIRIGLEYGVTDRFDIGIGRSSFGKNFDGFLKYKLLAQKYGANPFPFTLTAFTSTTVSGLENNNPERDLDFKHRVSYTGQLMIARKFSDKLSLQFTPTYIHRNLVPTEEDTNDLLSLGFGGRLKLTQRFAILGEYFYQVDDIESLNTFNALALGVEIETGGHVFQLSFTNSRAMIETGFINETADDFSAGDIRFGFNISRVFQL